MGTEEGSQGRLSTRRAVERLTPTLRGPQKPLEALQAVRHAQHALADARDFLTVAARREGATWAQIGTALGISRQAVQQAHARRQAEHENLTETVHVWHLSPPPRRRRFRWPFKRAS